MRLGDPIHHYCFANCETKDKYGSNDANFINAACNPDVVTHNVLPEEIMELRGCDNKMDENNRNNNMIKNYINPVVSGFLTLKNTEIVTNAA